MILKRDNIFLQVYIKCKLSGYYLGHVKENEERMCGCICMCAAISQLHYFHSLNTRSLVSSPHLKLIGRQLQDKPIQSCIYTIMGLQMMSPKIFGIATHVCTVTTPYKEITHVEEIYPSSYLANYYICIYSALTRKPSCIAI